jgi:hypothetical protein
LHDAGHNPFRDLLETYLLQEMIFHNDEMGQIVREVVTLEDFSTVTAKSIYRAAILGGGDFRKTIHCVREDYPDRVQKTFWARLAIMKKTFKEESREDWLPELDIDELLKVLRRNDDPEIIEYCLARGLFPREDERVEADGYSSQVPGVRH